MTTETRYDVALSFAGEQRQYVQDVALVLKDAGVRVFYDDYEKVELWGKDLYVHLDYVYRKASKYCILFISREYANKVWTNHERSSAQARALEANEEYVLPVRFDDTEIPGLRPTIGYLDISGMSPAELAGSIRDKLGPKTVSPGFPRKIDRLYGALHLKGEKGKAQKEEVRTVAQSFYNALARMTMEERKAVAGAFAFGCPGDLPSGVHISLDLLSRMTGMTRAEVIDSLSSVRSLNVKVTVRDDRQVHPGNEHELRGDDKDLLISFWSPTAPHAKDPSRVVLHMVLEASRHFCEDHGLMVVTGLDFHRLSGDESGILAIPEPHEHADLEGTAEVHRH